MLVELKVLLAEYPPAAAPLHALALTELVSIVTAPFRARALPDTMFAPVFRVMLASAIIFPLKLVLVPRVAEVPVWKNTLQALAPFIRTTDEPLAVVSALPILNTHTSVGPPSRVTAPVN